MKIVIDIPDSGITEDVLRSGWESDSAFDRCIKQACKNAVILPKGHGRLIDEKEACNLIAEGKEGDKAYFGTVSKDWEVIDFLKTVPTIIEPEKERKHE